MVNPQPIQPQKVDLYAPIIAVRGPAPLALRVAVPNQMSIADGVPVGGMRAATYVQLEALPEELRRRVELAVQALISAR